MLKKIKSFKILGLLLVVLLILLFLIGYKLSYNKNIEKINQEKLLNF